MSLPPDQAWFPAKAHGRGWGVPRRRQGWVVILVYVAAAVIAIPVADRHPLLYAVYLLGLTLLLILLGLWKGEPLRGR